MTPLDLARHQVKLRAGRDNGLSLTNHAIDRMAEMGVSLEQLGLIVRDGSSWLQRSGVTGDRGRLHWHPSHPEWGVVTAEDEPALVITVVFRCTERYERRGTSFERVPAGSKP